MLESPERTLLRVDGLSVVRGRRLVLDEVSFDARPGELIAVVGPNGAGKSTLFSALLGLVPAARGSFEAPGGFAFVPQSAPDERAFPVTALEVALMGAYRRAGVLGRLSPKERERGREALDRVGLRSPDVPYEQLSAGQRRRALVARALVQGGSVILLDEPFSDVDAISERMIGSVLDSECDRGCAVVIATHDLGFALHRSTRTLLLNGRAVAFGPPAEALEPGALATAYSGRLVVLGDGAHYAIDEDAHHAHAEPAPPWLPGETERPA